MSQLALLHDSLGQWDKAQERFEEAITLFRQLHNQKGIAGSYHNLGIIAQERGAYDEALEWYRRSLTLEEELGNRAGLASSYGQIGVLFTTRGTPDAAVAWNLRSFLIHAELRSPDIHIDLYWLTQQRQMLGEARFLSLLCEQLSKNDAQAILRQLDDFASGTQGNAVQTIAEAQKARAEEPTDRTGVARPEPLSTPPPVLPPEA